ncbi:IclR family transcriptional regulator [Levilactobacillus fujinensis]|uniref:IclR family transcriptional regulator n=1 Tax=Levilactobacillus fujinensis TaxID=2486024 RepID=A0ABW1TGS3_9LACO|nr:IclR family transcriptional regulator [Levilactobacillus fujinensis]
MADETKLNKTVIHVFDILDAINAADTSIGVSDLTHLTKLPKTTVFRLLTTLEAVNAVDKNANQQYKIGPRLIPYAKSVEHQNLLVQTAIPFMKDFVKQTKEDINLGVLYKDQVLYLHSEQGDKFRLQVNLFPVAPLYCSSLGKIFLSEFSPTDLDTYLAQEELDERTINTIVDPDKLKVEIAAAKKDQLAYDNEEYEYGLTCMAVPLYQDGKVVAAASVSGPTSRLRVRGWDNVKESIIGFGQTLDKLL